MVNIVTNHILYTGIISRVHKEFKKLNIKEVNNPIKKAMELKRNFSQSENQMSNKHL